MSDDGTEWGAEEFAERPFGGKPFGGKPFGGKPFGGKPFGGKPFGGRPFGGRPFGGRWEDERPFGGRPFGGRPFGGRPFGGRPFGGRNVGAGGGPDLDGWSLDIAQVLCEGSAVIRLGATIVAADDQTWVPAPLPAGGLRPVAAPVAAQGLELRPRGDVLEALVAVPDELAARVVDESGSSDAVTVDLGEELSRAADRAFLFQLPDGPASAPAPRAISRRTGIEVAAAADLLGTLRAVVAAVLGGVPRPAFRNPGWILHPDLLDRVSRIRTIDGLAESPANEARSLASFCLFRLVSADEGMLFGFPFATSAEATNAAGVPRLYFGADWQEAWIAVDPSFITVDIPGAPSVPNATVIRASMSVDFALRRETAFAWADPPPP